MQTYQDTPPLSLAQCSLLHTSPLLSPHPTLLPILPPSPPLLSPHPTLLPILPLPPHSYLHNRPFSLFSSLTLTLISTPNFPLPSLLSPQPTFSPILPLPSLLSPHLTFSPILPLPPHSYLHTPISPSPRTDDQTYSP